MKELEKEFIGRGEVSGYSFKQVLSSDKAYLYERSNEIGLKYYEVFKRKENKQFECISYPKSNSFGVWAWCIKDLNQAIEKYKAINI